MKIVLQRVSEASVSVGGTVIGSIQKGFMLLVGISEGDKAEDADWLAQKIANLRVFSDEDGKMNLSIHQINGEILSISQFTLLADYKKGNRPSFIKAAKPDVALPLFQYFNDVLRQAGISVATGQFGADMKVTLSNDGPVTIIMDSDDRKNDGRLV